MTNTVNKGVEDITFKELIEKTKEWCAFLVSKWKSIVVFSVLGALLGFGYSSVKPINYTAKITFILEESKTSSSGFGGLASLAGQFGVDVGAGSGGNILSGDNILLYFKSPSLAKEVLLSQVDSSSNETLADLYAKIYNLNEVWGKDKKIGKIKFIPINSKIPSNRVHDSLLQKIIESINTTQFNVARPDKKASFIEVTVNMTNENLAKIYCERIVQRVVDRYISIKTQRQKATVDKLQLRVDSIAALLRQKTLSGASLQNSSNTMDINPLYKTGSNVALEMTIRDKTLLSTIFASVTQNLEVAKFTLSQETPVIQIIDAPALPLYKNKISKLNVTFLFTLGFFFTAILFHIIKRLYENLMG